ncbi:hypothetical protein KKD03_01060 [Patescibacteria group bacterium]|nr:hypothetical protein [Patescibacteria group bacterium]
MQPHTGATIAVLTYLAPSIVSDPSSFNGQTFYVRTTILSSSGKHLYNKYHFIKTNRHNLQSRELEFEAGKDYACFMKVRYDAKFENFEFILHRHTHVREQFTIYIDSSHKVMENFSGEYVSEAGTNHRIKGRRYSAKRIEFEDTFKLDKYSSSDTYLKYVMEIL